MRWWALLGNTQSHFALRIERAKRNPPPLCLIILSYSPKKFRFNSSGVSKFIPLRSGNTGLDLISPIRAERKGRGRQFLQEEAFYWQLLPGSGKATDRMAASYLELVCLAISSFSPSSLSSSHEARDYVRISCCVRPAGYEYSRTKAAGTDRFHRVERKQAVRRRWWEWKLARTPCHHQADDSPKTCLIYYLRKLWSFSRPPGGCSGDF